jgi:hypothetical protein
MLARRVPRYRIRLSTPDAAIVNAVDEQIHVCITCREFQRSLRLQVSSICHVSHDKPGGVAASASSAACSVGGAPPSSASKSAHGAATSLASSQQRSAPLFRPRSAPSRPISGAAAALMPSHSVCWSVVPATLHKWRWEAAHKRERVAGAKERAAHSVPSSAMGVHFYQRVLSEVADRTGNGLNAAEFTIALHPTLEGATSCVSIS